jgi:hypothetical protein
MFIKLLIISLILVSLSLLFLGIRILLKPKGRFLDTHISQNREMQKLGLTCAKHTDIGCKPSNDNSGCATCNIRI